MPLRIASPKYNNRKVHAEGYVFGSIGEYTRYLVLKTEELAGGITDLEVHPSYELLPAFRDRNGKKHRAIFYVADFGYKRGHVIVEDYKGFATQVFLIKEKMFRYRYPEIDFRVLYCK